MNWTLLNAGAHPTVVETANRRQPTTHHTATTGMPKGISRRRVRTIIDEEPAQGNDSGGRIGRPPKKHFPLT
jgi:hypothetical protein